MDTFDPWKHIYIDESGSISMSKEKIHSIFIICILIPRNPKRLSVLFKRFISKNLKELRKIDKNQKMFNEDGSFRELKGSSLTKEMKIKFMEFFCRNNALKVRYIVLDNKLVEDKFKNNKARTFNYLLKLFFENCYKNNYLNSKNIFLHIDERNVKTGSKFSLEDYLNQELHLGGDIIEKVQVEYQDSSQNNLIQIADTFSNILYSDIITNGAYKEYLSKYKEEGYIIRNFKFPLQKRNRNKKK